MKKLEEMTYFELLDLIAWCEDVIEKMESGAGYYVELKERAAAAIKDKAINRCLEQFWAQKMNNTEKGDN